MEVRRSMNKKQVRMIKDTGARILLYLASAISVLTLVIIIGFVFVKGLPGISMNFLTRQWQDKTTFVHVALSDKEDTNLEDSYIAALGAYIKTGKDSFVITKLDKESPLIKAKNLKNVAYEIKSDDFITKVDKTNASDLTIESLSAMINNSATHQVVTLENQVVSKDNAKSISKNTDSTVLRFKITRPGGGIKPMIVSTLYIILLSLAISGPIGILSALYLTEYAKRGKILGLIHFAIQMLAGIPSIIYGLFGMLVFVQILKMQYSVLAGALTLSILLLPTIITTTSESLKAIPKGYRESSLGLGATKLQTNFKVVLPNALPGILVAIILSIGRIVGESAALIWTAGTIAQIPSTLTGNTASAATLTTKLYQLLKEEGDVATACSIAVVIILLIWVLNLISKCITKRFTVKG